MGKVRFETIPANQPKAEDTNLTKRVLLLALLVALLLLFMLFEQVQTLILSFLFPSEGRYTHSRKTILQMTGEHIMLTLLATALAATVGVLIGIAVTRKGGQDFQILILRLNAFIQTFPPSAVIILAYPVLGFGWKPALLALFLYSLFPILGNTVVGLSSSGARDKGVGPWNGDDGATNNFGSRNFPRPGL